MIDSLLFKSNILASSVTKRGCEV